MVSLQSNKTLKFFSSRLYKIRVQSFWARPLVQKLGSLPPLSDWVMDASAFSLEKRRWDFWRLLKRRHEKRREPNPIWSSDRNHKAIKVPFGDTSRNDQKCTDDYKKSIGMFEKKREKFTSLEIHLAESSNGLRRWDSTLSLICQRYNLLNKVALIPSSSSTSLRHQLKNQPFCFHLKKELIFCFGFTTATHVFLERYELLWVREWIISIERCQHDARFWMLCPRKRRPSEKEWSLLLKGAPGNW